MNDRFAITSPSRKHERRRQRAHVSISEEVEDLGREEPCDTRIGDESVLHRFVGLHAWQKGHPTIETEPAQDGRDSEPCRADALGNEETILALPLYLSARRLGLRADMTPPSSFAPPSSGRRTARDRPARSAWR